MIKLDNTPLFGNPIDWIFIGVQGIDEDNTMFLGVITDIPADNEALEEMYINDADNLSIRFSTDDSIFAVNSKGETLYETTGIKEI